MVGLTSTPIFLLDFNEIKVVVIQSPGICIEQTFVVVVEYDQILN
jgi:hypothetical protein